MSKIVIKGVRDAGLYNAFNASDFTINHLRNAAKYKLPTDRAKILKGVYARWNHALVHVLPQSWSAVMYPVSRLCNHVT